MKRLLIFLSALLMVTGCGISGYSSYDDAYYPSGSRHRHHHHSQSTYPRSSDGGVIFVSNRAKTVDVTIDNRTYRVKTVKYNSTPSRRNMEKTIGNTIPVRSGMHTIRVRRNGQIVYDQRVYVYSNDVKAIYL